LLRFGIIASIKKRTIQCTKGWQLEIMDAEYIQMFIDQIGFFSTEKSNLMPAIDKTIYNIFLLRRLKKTTASMTKRTILGSNSSKRQTPYKKTRISLQLGKKIKKIKRRQQQYYWDEIKAIEPIGSKKVYDLTIPNTHNFVANDICVHNTSFAMNLAQHVAIKENIPVAVFSMEMSDEQLAMRLISSLAKINLQSVRTGKLNDDEWSKMTEAVSQLESAPLFIDQTPALSPNDLRARVRRLAREQGQLGLVVIDYLQLMQVPESKESRANEVSEISRSLKSLAKELNVPVIALSQLNRSLEQRSDRRPKMSDLRESGSIEQDSDLIAFIYRDEVYNEDSPDKNTAEIIIAKQRNGPIGTIRLYFKGNITQFENYTPNDSYYGE
jgi:replicative DNA helicase